MTDRIKSDLDYIEQNLKTTISAEELAAIAGYSVWHYCRMFAQSTGITLARYICKRRIDCALAEIADGRHAIDVILEYGFDTYPGFYKAFVWMYGCSPRKYLSIYGKHKLTKYGGLYMTTERELRKILSNWDIPQDLPILDNRIMDGTKISGNEWYLGDSYILRHWERERIIKTLRLEKALAAQGFTSSMPVITKTGEEFLDGEHIYALTKTTPGVPLSKKDRYGKNRREFGIKYGVSIAKLHRALSDVEVDVMPDEFDLYDRIIEWSMPEVKKQNEKYRMELTNDFFDNYVKGFGTLSVKLPKQLIHRDPNPTNILFDNGNVSGFINYDLSERNIRLWDPCYCATGILSEWRDVEDIYEKWIDILDGILHGYDSENPLITEEKESVFHVLCSICMICVAWFEAQESDEFKALAKTNREMIGYIIKNKAKIDSIF